jgi:hypothetical protein
MTPTRIPAVLVILALLAGCGGGQTLALRITFPDEGAKLAVSAVSVWVISPSAQATCALLLSDNAKPGDSGYPIDAQVTFAMPLSGSAAPDPIKVDPPGRRLFLARAGIAGVVLLQGCTDLDTGKGGAVTVSLQWVLSTCSGSDDCEASQYCDVGSQRCRPCTDDDPRHCGADCLDCGAGATCSSGQCASPDGGSDSGDGQADGGADGADHGTDGGLDATDCTPQCDGRCGGPDACGGTCSGTCPGGSYCGGQSCSPCNSDQHCGDNCVNCLSQISNRSCREGACGCLTDGDCAASEICDQSTYLCCQPACAGKCGGADDACGGTCTDACPGGRWCNNQVCAPCEDGAHCGPECADCQAQAQDTLCVFETQSNLYHCGCNSSSGCFIDRCCSPDAACAPCDLSCCGVNCANCAIIGQNCCSPGQCQAAPCPGL